MRLTVPSVYTVMAAAATIDRPGSTETRAVTPSDETPTVHGVVGAIELDYPTSLGTFATAEGTNQHRDIPVTGAEIFADDARLLGSLDATLNYDIYRTGKEPVPAWGTMSMTTPNITR